MWWSVFRILDENIFLILLAYAVFGAGMKYIDDAFDKGTFSKLKAIAITPFLGLIGVLIVTANPFSATLAMSANIGVFSKRKIDNPAHLVTFSFLSVTFVMTFLEFDMEGMLFPLFFLSLAAVIDEIGNDVTDYDKEIRKSKMFRHRLFVYFFTRRYMLKVALLYLVLIGLFPIYILLAIIFFDEAYIIVELYSNSIKS